MGERKTVEGILPEASSTRYSSISKVRIQTDEIPDAFNNGPRVDPVFPAQCQYVLDVLAVGEMGGEVPSRSLSHGINLYDCLGYRVGYE